MSTLKNGIRLLAVIAVLMIGSSVHAQAVKLGYINDETLKTKYQPFARAQEQFETDRKALDKEAQDKQDELTTMLDDYNNQKIVLSDDKKKEREATIRAKKDALDAFTRQLYGPGGSLERKQQELLQPILERVNKAIQAVAEEENFDIIFTGSSGIGYIKPNLEVTEKVLAKLEKLDQ